MTETTSVTNAISKSRKRLRSVEVEGKNIAKEFLPNISLKDTSTLAVTDPKFFVKTNTNISAFISAHQAVFARLYTPSVLAKVWGVAVKGLSRVRLLPRYLILLR